MLGSSVLLKLNDELVVGQGDSSLNLANSLLEKAAGENGAKQYLYDEQDGDLSVTVMAEKQQEMALFNLWANKMEVECYYGGVNEGDIYYNFKGLITSFSKGDPAGGLSTIALSLKVNGKVTMKVVSNIEEVYYTLTVNVDEVMGSVVISPNYGSYQNGEIVSIKGVANEGYALRRFIVNGAVVLPDANGTIFLTMLQDTIADVILTRKADLQIYFDGWEYAPHDYFYLQTDNLNYLNITCLDDRPLAELLAFKNLDSAVIVNNLTLNISHVYGVDLWLTIKLFKDGKQMYKWSVKDTKTLTLYSVEVDRIELWAGESTFAYTVGDMTTINAPIELFFN